MSLRILVVVLGLFMISAVRAGNPPPYVFGESWWEEYVADDDTEILLHFGKPMVTGRQKLAGDVKKQRQADAIETDLMDLEAVEDLGGNGLGVTITPDDMKQAPVDDANVPANVILDYGDTRRRLKLPAGAQTVPDGRFGAGLAFDGTGPGLGFRVASGAAAGVELSFRVEAYPADTVCLISVADDESRLLLHPDGHLELKLAKPHGVPGAPPKSAPLTEQQLAAITTRDPTIRSPEPVALKTWVHVQIFNQNHPTPGGGEPWDARLKVDGFDVAWYQSERFNTYNYLGRGETPVVIGATAKGKQAFRGVVDQVRVLRRDKVLYERPVLRWRDTAAAREPQFDVPWFRKSNTVLHASLDHGLALDRHAPGAAQIILDLKGKSPDGLAVPGVRGSGWVVDRRIGLPRVPLAGLNGKNGALEFWLRPVNWDDVTGYWQHTPPRPPRDLTVVRLVGRDPQDGKEKEFLRVGIPRSHNIERGRLPVDPGHWMHCVLTWNDRWWDGGDFYVDTRRVQRAWRADRALVERIEPLYAEFGVQEEIAARRGEPALIEIDEVVAYSSMPDKEEIDQAYRRWQGELQAIPLYDLDLPFKWSLQRLDFDLNPKLIEGVAAATCEIRVTDAVGTAVWPAVSVKAADDGHFRHRLNDGETLPYAVYNVAFTLKDAAGKTVLEGKRTWNYEEDPWRHNTAGILDKPMPPWTPVVVDGQVRSTRMSRYVLAGNGLPAEIHADGENILAGPIRFEEAGKPLAGAAMAAGEASSVAADWQSTFAGQGATLAVQSHLEYDGMIKYTVSIQPTGKTVQPIRLVIPIKPEYASHALWYPMGDRGVKANALPAGDGRLLDSGWPRNPWRDFQAARKADPKTDYNQWWAGYREDSRSYGFYGHLDINDRNRGLWWFCDNAAGWQQSTSVGAITVERGVDSVDMVFNLIAEAGAYEPGTPIVFAILPHPARPMVPEYRDFQRATPEEAPLASDIFDAFRPWPTSPRAGGKSLNMTLYPATDPKNPEAGPSWEYAESTIPSLKASKPTGARTLYLSKAWFSCRAGAYDGWEWRSGDSHAVSLTPSFVNYLCWEMNEWIGRDIWDAVYLDECYEHPASNLEAGMSVRLPDGSEQPGVTNFQFRELMKRWRGIFHQHGKTPYMMAHHTYSWQYPGILYNDAYLDGENAPIVSLNSRDWIDSVSKGRYEVIQNGRLWGLASFYMPFIAEGGFENKEDSQFPRWQWRTARQAQAMFAHYETATVYEGQGSEVYHAYWRDLRDWGVGDVEAVSFHPYWDNAPEIQVPGQDVDTLVSYYRKKGAILLIASNLKKTETTARITLDLAALGLPASVRVRALDSSFVPVDGPDYLGAKGAEAAQKEALANLDNAIDLGGDDLIDELGGDLEDPTERNNQALAKLDPQIEGNVLVLPIRPHDYRVIVIEAK